MRRLLLALSCSLLQAGAAAQAQLPCDGIALATSRIVSRDTRDAGDAIVKLVRQAGADADLRAIRLRTLKDDYPKADVDVTTRRMLRAYCEVVWADRDLSNERKGARVKLAEDEMLKVVGGPSEVARTNSRIKSSSRYPGEFLLVTAPTGDLMPMGWRAAHWAAASPQGTQDEFLRDAPVFINDSTKYFVIVGSANSQNEAIGLMNRLKAKAPKYDFVVYSPYGSNTYYAVMMATWVSREVAQKALREARTYVVSDAYIWACRSTGESC